MDFKHVFENNRQAHIIDLCWLLRSLQEQVEIPSNLKRRGSWAL